MATPLDNDPIRWFLAGIGASGVDSSGQPIGSTGGVVPMGAGDSATWASLRGMPAQNAAPTGNGTVNNTQANPFAKLNNALGLNLGVPAQPTTLQSRLPAETQPAGSLAALPDQQRAAMIAQRIQDTGGLPQVGSPQSEFDGRMRAVEAIMNNTFMPPTPGPSSTFAPTGLRDRAIAAGGQEVAGTGGVMVSAGRNDAGGTNFNLRSTPQAAAPVAAAPATLPSRLPANGPSEAAMRYLRGGEDPNITEPTNVAPATPAAAPVAQPAGNPAPAQPPSRMQQLAGTYQNAAVANQERYTRTGPIQVGGRYTGDGVFDKATGPPGIMDANGQFQPLPTGAVPITATGLNKSIPDVKAFRQLKSDLTDAEISLRAMDRYIGSVGDAGQGIQRMADKFSAGMKTLVGKGLNPQEIATKMAQGQLQGLLGANRTTVVGGGVMTEQDALRIIQRLGGDVDALSNPEVVRKAISEVYSDRYQQYQDSLKFYNSAVEDFYGSRGFKPSEEVKFSEKMRFDVEPAAAPAAGGMTPEKRKRLEELRAKRGQKEAK